MADYLGLSLPSSPPALNPRLSPEIYLKRPAHSDEWRLDIMLKKKAVRRVVSLEGRCEGGLSVGGGWLEGTTAWGTVRNLRLQGRKRAHPGSCPANITSSSSLRRSDTSLFMCFLYLV